MIAETGKQRLSRQRLAKRVAFYVRASPDGPAVQSQLGDLRAIATQRGWQVVQIFSDKGISGTKATESRPEFDKLKEAIAAQEIEMVAAWSVDRLGRSVKDLVSLLSDMRAKRVDLVLFQQGLDTSTPSDRAKFQWMGVFSEFEASMAKDSARTSPIRTRKKSSRPVGKQPVEKTKEDEALELLKSRKMGILEIARKLKLGTGTVVRIAKSMRKG